MASVAVTMAESPRRTIIGLTIFATAGSLMIALPAVIEKHADRVALGTGIGTAVVVALFTYGVANRGSRSTSSRPAWASGIGILAAAVGIILGKVGLGGNFALGLTGGMLLSYAVGVVVLPLVVTPRN
jgi:hypothetical protein